MALPPIDRLLEFDQGQLDALQSGLRQAGYSSEVLKRAESLAVALLDPLRLPLVRDALVREGSPGAGLARLFTYHDAITRAELEGALGTGLAELLLAGGILAEAEGQPDAVRSLFQLVPLGEFYFLSDPMESGGEAVMGPGQTTVPLIRFASDLPGASVLDVGCGAGAIAIAAARRGARALGVDINPRAIELARWNARLNHCDAEFREGDLTAPARGERFDLVLAQPPFVMQPDAVPRVTYLHGGRYGDELAMRLVTELPGVLKPGGAATVLLDTAQRPGPAFVQRVREMLREAPVDLVALLTDGVPSAVQAVAYATLDDPTVGPTYRESVVRYARHLAALEIPGFHHALLFVRAPFDPAKAGRYSIQLQVRSLTAVEPSHVRELFHALDLASLPDEDLLAAAVALTDGTRWTEERSSPSVTIEPACQVHLPTGSPLSAVDVPSAAFALFEILADSASVGEAIGRYAALCECETEEVRSDVLGFVREGLTRGVVRPRVPGAPGEA